MIRKKASLYVLSFALLGSNACQSSKNSAPLGQNDFSIASLNTDTFAEPAKKEVLSYERQSFSHIPENDSKALAKNNIVPGAITVVYDNSAAMYLDTAAQKFKSASPQAEQVETILKKFNVVSKYDLAQGMSAQEIRADYDRMSVAFEGDIPDRRSVHTYNLPKDADIIKLIKELSALPFVRTAEPVYSTELSYTRTQLSLINPSITGTPPADPVYSNPESNWWYFKRHQLFKGLEEFGSITTAKTPTIAVIDQSFDTSSLALDRPNYLTGKRFLNCYAVNAGCVTGSDVTPDSGSTLSHGTNVATVLASPRNNGQGFSGFAPFAKIIPYKVTVTSGLPATDYSIATAIRDAKNNPDVDVINLSLSSEGNTCPKPISSSVVRTEVASAFAAGKVVVFAAGNGSVDVHGPNRPFPDTTSNCSGLGDGGAIIVGGLANDISVNPSRTMGWSSSNFDTTTTKIDIAAAAQNIYAAEYDQSLNFRSITGAGSGTSLAAPMVSATAAMMMRLYKSVNPGFSLSPSDVQAILIAAADVSRYSNSASNAPETKFLGRQLADRSDNDGKQMVGARVLNVHNAMVMTKHLKQHQALVRLHNSDDKSQSTVNSVWTGTLMENTFGNDTIWGVNGLSTGNNLAFRTENENASTGYTYGRSYLRRQPNNVLVDFTNFGGVLGAAWAESNSTKPIGWYATTFSVNFN